MTYAFGGPANYSGATMRAAHSKMKLTDEHFNAVAENLVASLKELNVPQELIDQVVAVALSVKDDVLNKPIVKDSFSTVAESERWILVPDDFRAQNEV